MKTIYIVNYKETTIDESGVMSVECGTCEVGYTDEKDAIQKCYELSDDKMNEFIPDARTNEDGTDDNDELYRDSNDNGDWQCVHHLNDTFEYWVSVVDVM